MLPTYGGLYVTHGIPQCTASACYTPHAETGACSCPAGFVPHGPYNVLDDRGCPSGNPPYGWSSAYFCVQGTPTTDSDFGGVYQRTAAEGCVANNPWTGGCTCPAGMQAIELVTDGACWLNRRTGICWNPSATPVSFGGTYQLDDGSSCTVANPATGGCSCPAGTTSRVIRAVHGPSDIGCSKSGSQGANLHVCTATP
ncbi:MAG: hypothetical protein FJ104_13810 [Deltaproteobacteria bacterium]|nr:hypothetical protein [Deltaproteobacteria bacterium]